MKNYTIAFLLIFLSTQCQAQELAGFQIIDYLRTVEHPNCNASKDKYITGPPNDSMWVNIIEEFTISGEFGSAWINGDGAEMILHSAFNLDKYRVKLELADGSYSQEHAVTTAQWESLDEPVLWTLIFDTDAECLEDVLLANQRIVKLDFETDFGLAPSEAVVGIELTLVPTSAATDISGIYITDNALPCKLADLENDFTMCSSDSIILNPGDFNSYLWNDLSTDSQLKIDASLFDIGIHSFNVTVADANGCVSTDSINITIESCWDFEAQSTCKNIILYPVPSDNQLNFQFQNFETDKELLIYAADGRLVNQVTLISNELSLDISAYGSGIYFAKTNNTCCKFVKISTR